MEAGLHKIEMRRFERGGLLGHNGKLGQRTHAQAVDGGEDSISRLEARDARPHLHYYTR
jgi:hypothetical protein